MDEVFQDMLNKGLVSVSGREINLSKLTVRQAAFYVVLANSVDYLRLLGYDAVDWREWMRLYEN
jgi:hypothetical protein